MASITAFFRPVQFSFKCVSLVVVCVAAFEVWLVAHYSTSNDGYAIHDQISSLWRSIYISADVRFIIRVLAKFFHFFSLL